MQLSFQFIIMVCLYGASPIKSETVVKEWMTFYCFLLTFSAAFVLWGIYTFHNYCGKKIHTKEEENHSLWSCKSSQMEACEGFLLKDSVLQPEVWPQTSPLGKCWAQLVWKIRRKHSFGYLWGDGKRAHHLVSAKSSLQQAHSPTNSVQLPKACWALSGPPPYSFNPTQFWVGNVEGQLNLLQSWVGLHFIGHMLGLYRNWDPHIKVWALAGPEPELW